ncbi:MAG TPA: c-type cytochrome [Polyangiaceae bacterium]|jgi:cytochrome c oxidase cbb3-type subunit 3|nr:c-type cytochrome [Polyangiaceae bacterium]
MSGRLASYVIACCAALACSRQIRDLDASGQMPDIGRSAPQPAVVERKNAYALSEGQRLYTWFNCNGCHGLSGGGAIGPALRDAAWIYGGTPGAVYTSIVAGRSNGMPAFGFRMPRFEARQLAAYVLSLANAVPVDVAPGRADSMSAVSQPERETASAVGTTGRVR